MCVCECVSDVCVCECVCLRVEATAPGPCSAEEKICPGFITTLLNLIKRQCLRGTSEFEPAPQLATNARMTPSFASSLHKQQVLHQPLATQRQREAMLCESIRTKRVELDLAPHQTLKTASNLACQDVMQQRPWVWSDCTQH